MKKTILTTTIGLAALGGGAAGAAWDLGAYDLSRGPEKRTESRLLPDTTLKAAPKSLKKVDFKRGLGIGLLEAFGKSDTRAAIAALTKGNRGCMMVWDALAASVGGKHPTEVLMAKLDKEPETRALFITECKLAGRESLLLGVTLKDPRNKLSDLTARDKETDYIRYGLRHLMRTAHQDNEEDAAEWGDLIFKMYDPKEEKASARWKLFDDWIADTNKGLGLVLISSIVEKDEIDEALEWLSKARKN